MDIAPLIVTEPVDMEMTSFRVVVDAPIVSAPAVRIPAPTLIVWTNPLFGLIMVMRPETARVLVPDMVNVELAPIAFVKFMVAHAAGALTVTIKARSIFTASPATGKIPAPTAAPPEESDQVVLELQLPDALE